MSFTTNFTILVTELNLTDDQDQVDKHEGNISQKVKFKERCDSNKCKDS